MRAVSFSIMAIFIFMLWVNVQAFAASDESKFAVSGFICDMKSGDALDAVTIKIKGKKKTYKADKNGRYELLLDSGIYDMTFLKKAYLSRNVNIVLNKEAGAGLKVYKNIELEPCEKGFKIKGKLIERVSGAPVRSEMRINDEIVFSDENGYFECSTQEGDISIKIYSKEHRAYKKVFSRKELEGRAQSLEIFLERYTFFSKAYGNIKNKKTKEPIYGAVIEIDGERCASDNLGYFEIDINKSGRKKIVCMHENFEKIIKFIKLKIGKNKITINMVPKEKSLLQAFKEKYEKEFLD